MQSTNITSNTNFLFILSSGKNSHILNIYIFLFVFGARPWSKERYFETDFLLLWKYQTKNKS